MAPNHGQQAQAAFSGSQIRSFVGIVDMRWARLQGAGLNQNQYAGEAPRAPAQGFLTRMAERSTALLAMHSPSPEALADNCSPRPEALTDSLPILLGAAF